MILGINSLGTRGGGCETVLRSLLDGLTASPTCRRHIERIVVFVLPRKSYQFDYPASDRVQIIPCPGVADNAITRYAWLSTAFRHFIRPHGCDVLLNMSGVAPAVDMPQVLMIQSSLYFSPEAIATYRLPDVPWRLRVRNAVEVPLSLWFFSRSCRVVERVIVQSEVMRTWVQQGLPGTIGRVHVVRPAIPELIDPAIQPVAALSSIAAAPGARLLYVGNDQPYKNLKVLVDAARFAWETGRDWRFFLTLSGLASPTPPNMVFLGQLSRAEIAAALRTADALLMPSLVETVGLPMIEALSLGTPVIAADRPYAREFCQSGASYFDPHDAASLCGAIERMERMERMERDGSATTTAARPARDMLSLPNAVEFAEQIAHHCLASMEQRQPSLPWYDEGISSRAA